MSLKNAGLTWRRYLVDHTDVPAIPTLEKQYAPAKPVSPIASAAMASVVDPSDICLQVLRRLVIRQTRRRAISSRLKTDSVWMLSVIFAVFKNHVARRVIKYWRVFPRQSGRPFNRQMTRW